MTDVSSSKRAPQHLGEVGSVTDFLGKIYPHVNGRSNYLFRGHRCSDWALKPAVAREASSVELEAEMLEEFKRRALPYIEAGSTLSDADWLAIAQHHGMPTRLLDWSGSALAALWFAVRKPSVDGRSGAVWILRYEDAGDTDFADERERNEPFKIRETRLIRPRHVTRRITAQEGWFSLHRRAENGKGPAFVSLETNQRFAERLHFVTIPPEAFGPVRVQLGMAGIGAAVLFPDLDGIAQHVTWVHQSPTDELRTRVGWPCGADPRA